MSEETGKDDIWWGSVNVMMDACVLSCPLYVLEKALADPSRCLDRHVRDHRSRSTVVPSLLLTFAVDNFPMIRTSKGWGIRT